VVELHVASLGNEPSGPLARGPAVTWKRLVARTISECAAMGGRIAGCRRGFRILLYHAVGSRVDHDTYGLSIRPKMFERHMAVLANSQWVSVVDLREGLTAASPLRVAVTFDDGYRDTLAVAAPILLKYKIPFAVFVTAAFVRSGSSLYLIPAELRELADLPGVTIGSHGSSHAPLADCDEAALWQEVDGSRRALEDMIGRPVTSIAYPHGSVNRRVRDAARRAGYTVGVCSRFDINGSGRDPLLLCRTEVLAVDSERVFLQKLEGAWDWYRWRRPDPARVPGDEVGTLRVQGNPIDPRG